SEKNYNLWKDDVSVLPEYAMFDENLTDTDLDEKDLHFGDQYQLGEASIEVSEIREPCWKIQEKYKIPNLIKRMSSSCKTGCYLRVVKEGFVNGSSQLQLIKYGEQDSLLSVFELNDIYYNDNKNVARLAYALKNPYLTEERRHKLEKYLKRAQK